MKSLEAFIERNKDFIREQTVDQLLIDKYKKILPEEIIYIWKTFGFGTFENGFIRFVKPIDYEWALQCCRVYLNPTIPIAITALGDLIVWEGNDNPTVAKDEGNRYSIYIFRKGKKEILGSRAFVINRKIADKEFIVDKNYFDAAIYYDAAEKLGTLEYDESYGFVPILALGGSEKVENIKKVKSKEYINIICQTIGSIG